MDTIRIPYARGYQAADIESSHVKATLMPRAAGQIGRDEPTVIEEALAAPIGSPALADLCRSSRRVLVITSDHTRPMPSAITLPLLLREIRRHNSMAEVTILVATGFHRQTRIEEMIGKFGADLLAQERFVIHDGQDGAHMVFKGLMPSGGELWLNDLVDWADMIVAEGFIEPHFFAGFSGGRKSVLPGIASKRTVLANHCSAFIGSDGARTGNLDGNPLHADMIFAAREAGLRFILNVALDSSGRIAAAFAGDPEQAHLEGCAWVAGHATVQRQTADIVITSNGGYPLDQNIYQAVKGMTAGEACVRSGGVIIMVAACDDGHGGEDFYNWFAKAGSPAEVSDRIRGISQADTLPDQWEAQILARVLQHCHVILVSDRCDPSMIRAMHMEPAHDLETALKLARQRVGAQAEIIVIPNGVAVIVQD